MADRLKAALLGAVRSVLGPIDHMACYWARVIRQPTETTVDVQPEDSRLPTMRGLTLLVGTPGTVVNIAGGRVLVGWSGGDPAQPYAQAFDPDVRAIKLDLTCPQIRMGEPNTAVPGLLGQTYRAAEATTNQGLIAAFTALAAASVGPLAALQGQFTTIASLLTSFEAGAAAYLSKNVRTS